MKKLAVAIPTYNRCAELKECIESVISQINDDVAIYVFDNSTLDDSEIMMKQYSEMKFIHYKRNKKNCGMDGNFLKCLTIPDGEYIHILSDDDVMLPGTINAILDYIEKEPAFIHLYSILMDSKFVEQKERHVVCKSVGDYLRHVGIWMTFCSSIVVKKEVIDYKDSSKYLGTFFLQVYLSSTAFKSNNNIIIRLTPGIGCRAGNAGGYNFYRIWFQEYKRLLYSFGKYGVCRKDLKKLYIQNIIKDLPQKTYEFEKGRTAFYSGGKIQAFFITFMHPAAWIFLYPIMFSTKNRIDRKYKRYEGKLESSIRYKAYRNFANIKRNIEDRKLLIWGRGAGSHIVKQTIGLYRLELSGYIDLICTDSVKAQYEFFDNIEDIQQEKFYIIVSLISWNAEIEYLLKANGFREKKDYIWLLL